MTDPISNATDELEAEITIYLTAYCDMLDRLDIDGRCRATDADWDALIARSDDYDTLRLTGLLAIDMTSWDGAI